MTERRARAELELDPQAAVPNGVLTADDGRRFAFSGWTELASAIEEWRSGPREPRGASVPPTSSTGTP